MLRETEPAAGGFLRRAARCLGDEDPRSAVQRTGWGRIAGYALCLAGGWLGMPGALAHVPGVALLFPAGIIRLVLSAPNARSACLDVFLAGALAWLPPIFWVRMPALVQGGATAKIAWLWPVVIAVGQGMYLAIFAGLVHLAARRCGPVLLGLYAGLGWWAMEMAKTTWCKCPLVQFVAGLSFWPWMVQACSLVGAFGLAGAIAACAVWLLAPSGGIRPKALGAAALLVLAAHGLLVQDLPPDPIGGVRLALIQGNTPVLFKWDPARTYAILDRYAGLTARALENTQADLVLWPETALPTYYLQGIPSTAMIKEIARVNKTPLLLGVLAPEPDGAPDSGGVAVYNQAVLLGAAGEDLGYTEKQRLVPFGEYIPKYFGFIPRMVSDTGQTRPGRKAAPLTLGECRLGVLICFESMFPWVSAGLASQGANVLVNLSNDAYFTGTGEPSFHLAHAVLRAVEQGRFMVRCANTGITSVIGPRGQVLNRAAPDQALFLNTGEVGLIGEPTVYNRIGERLHQGVAGGFLALTAGFAAAAILARRSRAANTDPLRGASGETSGPGAP